NERYNANSSAYRDGYQLHYRRKDGTTFPSRTIGSVIKTPTGELLGYLGIITDISDQITAERALKVLFDKQKEQTRALKRINAKLKASNEELEQFAYVSSHDLQEPLRKISSFCELLEEEFSDTMSEDAKLYVRYATDGARRMQGLLRDLLSYSRLNTRAQPFGSLDMDLVLVEVWRNLSRQAREAGATMTAEALPTLVGDDGQLTQLFQHLLDNAIKYRHPDRTPRIHVSAVRTADGAHWQFSVEDNGLGIDPQFRERIFTIFQRLHPRHQYDGTGIGLAICARVVQRHGGRMWVEGDPGRGSIFCFTIATDLVAGESPQGARGMLER
ncbi:MAG: ATP-binding protein, partial [Myxococcota bacterium]